mgnify:CR=1 FL=1
MHDKPKNFKILAPIGAFGNHLRWLLLLDDHFNLEVPMVPLGKISISIAATFPKVWLSSLDAKLKFIKNHVYGRERTWNNWLITEWYYRDYLHGSIGLYHEVDRLDTNSQFITMLTDPDLAYRCYFKFNPNLNNTLPQDFKKYIARDNEYIQSHVQNNVLTIKSSTLYNSVLDRELYESVTEFFGLQNLYNVASEIHTLWYDLHQRSEQAFVRDVINFYSKEQL